MGLRPCAAGSDSVCRQVASEWNGTVAESAGCRRGRPTAGVRAPSEAAAGEGPQGTRGRDGLRSAGTRGSGSEKRTLRRN